MHHRGKVSWESKAFLLHTKPLKEGKVLAFLFSETSGMVTAVTRYAAKRRRGQQALSSFQTYWWRAKKGHSDLLSTVSAEREGVACWLVQDRLMCGLYLNELLMKLCQPWDPHPAVFDAYVTVLLQLAQPNAPLQPVLRQFDLILLQALGYGIPFAQITASDHTHFQYHFEMGFVPAVLASQHRFHRDHLLAICDQQWQVPGALAAAKTLCRMAIQGALGEQKLKSRALFEQPLFQVKRTDEVASSG